MKPLEDLQKDWDAVDKSPQYILTPDKIKDMMQQRYRSRIFKLIWPEVLGSLVCLYFAALIFFMFEQLDTLFLQAVGVATIILLLMIPFLALLPLLRMYRIGQSQLPYREALKAFANQKIWISRVQQLSFGVGFLLFNAMIILCTKIYNEEDVTQGKYFWAKAFVVGFLFVLFISRFAKRYYQRTIGEAEELLTDLKD